MRCHSRALWVSMDMVLLLMGQKWGKLLHIIGVFGAPAVVGATARTFPLGGYLWLASQLLTILAAGFFAIALFLCGGMLWQVFWDGLLYRW